MWNQSWKRADVQSEHYSEGMIDKALLNLSNQGFKLWNSPLKRPFNQHVSNKELVQRFHPKHAN